MDRTDKVFCSYRKCEKDCVRFHRNAPWNIVFYRHDYKPNNDGSCVGYLENWSMRDLKNKHI